jgi:6-phosphogluconate dehydrogenase
VPIIDIAVSMRNLSKYKNLRISASRLYPDSRSVKHDDKDDGYIHTLEQAFYFSMISAYAQGMHLLYRANEEYDYKLKLDLIAKVWRGGCIIRSKFLENIYAAYKENSNLEHLFLNDDIHKSLAENFPGIRTVVSEAALRGIAVPAFSVALSYFDNFRSKEMPTNLIQAQRDYFGSHTYELQGKKGAFHTQWKDMG